MWWSFPVRVSRQWYVCVCLCRAYSAAPVAVKYTLTFCLLCTAGNGPEAIFGNRSFAALEGKERKEKKGHPDTEWLCFTEERGFYWTDFIIHDFLMWRATKPATMDDLSRPSAEIQRRNPQQDFELIQRVGSGTYGDVYKVCVCVFLFKRVCVLPILAADIDRYIESSRWTGVTSCASPSAQFPGKAFFWISLKELRRGIIMRLLERAVILIARFADGVTLFNYSTLVVWECVCSALLSVFPFACKLYVRSSLHCFKHALATAIPEKNKNKPLFAGMEIRLLLQCTQWLYWVTF